MFSSQNSQVSSAANYIEDVFSTYLYTGNAPSSQSITNGIDLAGKGGLVWLKNRSVGTGIGNELYNTNVGAGNFLSSNNTNANTNTTAGGTTYGLSSFNSNGFTVNDNWSGENTNGQNIVSWTFRKQPKFFDVVTYTGDGTAGRTISHNLGSKPGCMIVKCIDDVTNWPVYNQALGASAFGYLNVDAAWNLSSTAIWNGTEPTTTQFTVGSNGNVNTSGKTYVAYLFAHNAGGFGLTGTDNVISCGSVAATGGVNNVVNLGYEPQLVIIKSATVANDWHIIDNMRGFTANNGVAHLFPNSSTPEYNSGTTDVCLTSTGFTLDPDLNGFNGTGTYIYIAIRRGPMKVPTSGTSVFAISTAQATAPWFYSGFATDFQFSKIKDYGYGAWYATSRLTGLYSGLYLNTTSAEFDPGAAFGAFDYNTGVGNNTGAESNRLSWMFRRAPSFFDEVCYTGTGSATTVTHNLAAVPELMIVKNRGGAAQWVVYSASLGNTKYLSLNLTDAEGVFSAAWNNTSPTSSNFTVGGWSATNLSGYNFVAYLFATCVGVQYINSYVGDGTTGRTINCGFTGGARFVCIKATSTSGSWWTFDSARGIVTNNDPALQLNSTAAEVTSADAIDTASSGFIVNQEATCSLNASGVTYLVWAIA